MKRIIACQALILQNHTYNVRGRAGRKTAVRTNDDQGKDVVPTKQTEERKLTRHGNKNKMQGHLLCILTSVWALRTPNAG